KRTEVEKNRQAIAPMPQLEEGGGRSLSYTSPACYKRARLLPIVHTPRSTARTAWPTAKRHPNSP
ncbi:MAG: hypothetical protein KJ876_01040, partial [Alphaproteobacteria bacterium]|nr:hypothetical protein [Alphaproteobacteria bacterium]